MIIRDCIVYIMSLSLLGPQLQVHFKQCKVLVHTPSPADLSLRVQLMEWCQTLLGQRIFTWLMKKTVYGQFVAGEDLEAIKPKIQHLRASGIRSILDYAVEEDLGKEQEVMMELRQTVSTDGDSANLDPAPPQHYTNPQFKPSRVRGDRPTTRSSALTHFYAGEQRCEDNVAHFKSCIRTAAEANADSELKDAFAAIKLTGLGRVEFLVRYKSMN